MMTKVGKVGTFGVRFKHIVKIKNWNRLKSTSLFCYLYSWQRKIAPSNCVSIVSRNTALVTAARVQDSMRGAGQCVIFCAGGICNIKHIVLALLVIQNVTSILCMKHASRQKASDGHQALTTSIVVVSEVVKVTICLGEIFVRY